MSAKVSVIIPVYNTEEYLAECLESVINQTLRDIEIIIINDASPDNSVEIIKRYMSKDGRIVLIDKKQNEGVGKARNDGIDKATGEFVCFMDSDDLYSENDALEALYRAATENNVPVSGGRLEMLKDDGSVQIKENPFSEYGIDFYQNGLMNYGDYQYDYGYTCSIYNRKMITENGIYFPHYSRFQDPPFYVKAMNDAGSYYFIDKPVYRYRLLPLSSKYSLKKTLDMLDGLIENLNYSREKSLAKLHFLTAQRLNAEGSYMAIKNLQDERCDELLSLLIKASNAVDVQWIKQNGFDIKEPFVLDVFKYAAETAGKYESLRNRGVVKVLRKLTGKR